MNTAPRPAVSAVDRVAYVIGVILIGTWALPWAVLSVIVCVPWLAPSLFEPDTLFWPQADDCYALDGVVMPMALLLVGMAAFGAGWSWRRRGAWVAMVAAGCAYEYLTLPWVVSVSQTLAWFPERLRGHWHPAALAWGSPFVLLALAAAVLLLTGMPHFAGRAARKQAQ